MTRQGDGHSLGQQRRHRDALGLHLFVEGIQLVGGDGVTNAEAGNRQARLHVFVHRTLEGVEGHGLAGPTKAVARRSRRGRCCCCASRGSSGGRSFRHPGHGDGLTGGLLHVFRLNPAVGAAAAHGGQVHTHLGGQLLGPGAGHDATVVHHRCRRCRGSNRCRCRGRSRSWGLDRSWRGRRSRCRGGRRSRSAGGLGLHVGDLSLGFDNQTDGFAHRCCAASRHQDRCEVAVLERLNVHVRFVGLNDKNRLAPSHLVSGLFQPLHDLPLRHGGAEGRHEDVCGRQNRLREGRSGEFTSQQRQADQASSIDCTTPSFTTMATCIFCTRLSPTFSSQLLSS